MGQRYLAIISKANAAGTKLAAPFDGYANGTTTLPQFKVAVASYVAASDKVQSELLAVHWPKDVERDVERIVAADKKLVAQLEALPKITRSKLKTPLDRVDRTLTRIHNLSNRARMDLGLPRTTG